ncbi:MAG: RNA polymerase sigma factor [Deltaproteobacteria bacterium]|nr:MAG: RNA polymerase sigma factor [Deltaproteobacteria bacterium]
MAAADDTSPARRHLRVVGAPATEPGPAVIAAACRGDREAAGRVLAHVLPLARRLVAAVVRRSDRIDDVVQQALMEVLEALPSFEGRTSVRGWARTIVLRVAFRSLRKEARISRVTVDAVDPDTLRATLHEPVGDALPRPVADYLAALSVRHREVLVLHHALGYTIPEIADTLGISPNTVKSRLLHARRNVRRLVRRDLRFGAGGGSRMPTS